MGGGGGGGTLDAHVYALYHTGRLETCRGSAICWGASAPCAPHPPVSYANSDGKDNYMEASARVRMCVYCTALPAGTLALSLPPLFSLGHSACTA